MYILDTQCKEVPANRATSCYSAQRRLLLRLSSTGGRIRTRNSDLVRPDSPIRRILPQDSSGLIVTRGHHAPVANHGLGAKSARDPAIKGNLKF